MRLVHGFALAVAITLPSVLAVACFDAVNDCERNANLPCYAEGTGGSSGTGLPSGCDPLELEGGALGDTCGVFVNPSVAPGGNGTQSSPYATIAEAIAGSSGKAIFVCATAGDLTEAVEVSANVTLIGGVTCEDWKLASTRTSWTAKADEVPLKLLATPSGQIQGFDIVAKPGSGIEPTTRAGKSSIAVIAESATATFIDVSMTAGAGFDGDDGNTFGPDRAPGSQGGNNGFDGNQGTGCATGDGGPAKTFPSGDGCPGDGGTSTGGPGGSVMGEQDGQPGVTDPRLGDPNGEGSTACTTGAQTGEAGHDGPNGSAGGKGTTAGAVLSSSGYQGDPGKPGEDGRAGQGGGGGAARPTKINLCVNMTGYGGGSGGAGGCGGRAGGGGGAGGASIALLSLQSTLTLRRVTLTASTGGTGGVGGDLQPGGEGGDGGNGGAGAAQACDGGPGGNGGSGGPGGGGAGGPSIGIAHTGAAPTPEGDVTITVATAASLGGNGGNGNMGDNRGEDGLVGQIQSF